MAKPQLVEPRRGKPFGAGRVEHVLFGQMGWFAHREPHRPRRPAFDDRWRTVRLRPVDAHVQHRVSRVGVLLEPGPSRTLLEDRRTRRQPGISQEPLVVEHLERGASVRHDGRFDSDAGGAVVHEPPQVRILDAGVRDSAVSSEILKASAYEPAGVPEVTRVAARRVRGIPCPGVDPVGCLAGLRGPGVGVPGFGIVTDLHCTPWCLGMRKRPCRAAEALRLGCTGWGVGFRYGVAYKGSVWP